MTFFSPRKSEKRDFRFPSFSITCRDGKWRHIPVPRGHLDFSRRPYETPTQDLKHGEFTWAPQIAPEGPILVVVWADIPEPGAWDPCDDENSPVVISPNCLSRTQGFR